MHALSSAQTPNVSLPNLRKQCYWSTKPMTSRSNAQASTSQAAAFCCLLESCWRRPASWTALNCRRVETQWAASCLSGLGSRNIHCAPCLRIPPSQINTAHYSDRTDPQPCGMQIGSFCELRLLAGWSQHVVSLVGGNKERSSVQIAVGGLTLGRPTPGNGWLAWKSGGRRSAG